MMQLHGKTLAPGQLAAEQVQRLFALMQQSYGGCTLPRFLRDLEGKDKVLLLLDEQDHIQGFTTTVLFDFQRQGEPLRMLFSGDTVIAAEARGSTALMCAWWQLVCDLLIDCESELYWMLISKGWRTYKMLPLFFREFYPDRRCPTPLAMAAFMEALGRARFGDQYENGLILPPEPDFLLSGAADVSPRRAKDLDVGFFLERNPQFYAGHELLCVCRLHPDNLTPLARNLFHAEESHGHIAV